MHIERQALMLGRWTDGRWGLATALVLATVVAGWWAYDALAEPASKPAAEPAEQSPSAPAEKSSEKSDAPPPPGRDVLSWWVSPWRVTERHFSPDGRTIEVKGTETIKWVLEEHAIQRDYTSGSGSRTFHALGLLTFNSLEQRYQGNWYDNLSTTGPSKVFGTWDDANRTMTFIIETVRGQDKTQRYRIVERFTDDDHRVATTYELRGRDEIKKLEVIYKRVLPCPANDQRLRGVDDWQLGGEH